jgi:hypothetical protein
LQVCSSCSTAPPPSMVGRFYIIGYELWGNYSRSYFDEWEKEWLQTTQNCACAGKQTSPQVIPTSTSSVAFSADPLHLAESKKLAIYSGSGAAPTALSCGETAILFYLLFVIAVVVGNKLRSLHTRGKCFTTTPPRPTEQLCRKCAAECCRDSDAALIQVWKVTCYFSIQIWRTTCYAPPRCGKAPATVPGSR